MKTRTLTSAEVCCVLLGQYRAGIWHAKLSWRRLGTHSSVMFDGERVLEREERNGDVVGFFHTHPDGFTGPSERDVRTMRAWCFCFGKPLLCVISTREGPRAWLSQCAEPELKEIGPVAIFKSDWLVAVNGEDDDAPSTP
jgi:hypothetical protein